MKGSTTSGEGRPEVLRVDPLDSRGLLQHALEHHAEPARAALFCRLEDDLDGAV